MKTAKIPFIYHFQCNKVYFDVSVSNDVLLWLCAPRLIDHI